MARSRLRGCRPANTRSKPGTRSTGPKTMKVKVEAKGEGKANFTYEATTAYVAPSLKVMPALVLH